jgi:hypothetical protein
MGRSKMPELGHSIMTTADRCKGDLRNTFNYSFPECPPSNTQENETDEMPEIYICTGNEKEILAVNNERSSTSSSSPLFSKHMVKIIDQHNKELIEYNMESVYCRR